MAMIEKKGPGKRGAVKRHSVSIIILLILTLATLLRIYRLKDYPSGFFCDEASIGYNAFTILHFGADEYGEKYPLYFRAFGEYKNPLYIYCTAPFVWMFGLDEFSTRLPAALFGILTVFFTFLLFREMFSVRVGVLAALLLAISNWHIHFSRIAFELISLPCFFTLGLYLLYRGTVRRSSCIYFGAAVMGLSCYTYGTARVFIPLFLLGYAILFLKYFSKRKLALSLAVVIFTAAVYPLARYNIKYPGRAMARFGQISIFKKPKASREYAEHFWENYKKHFSWSFLFENGDLVKRHSVPGRGELYRADIPLYILGLLVLIFGFRRECFLLLWWLALFPVAASITTQVPSATRSIVAIPVLPGIAAVGLAFIFKHLFTHRHIIIKVIGCIAVGAYIYYLVPEFREYLNLYYSRYPIYSAEGIYGFQYGYREVINYMQSQEDDYDRLIVTSKDSNRPDVFVKFYTANPEDYRYGRRRKRKFSIFRADEYSRYSMKDKILYCLRPKELAYFSNFKIKKEIKTPDGKKPFVITCVEERKEYIRDWMILGLFDNRGGSGKRKDFIDIDEISAEKVYEGKQGRTRWRKMLSSFTKIDLNGFFRNEDREHPGNPEDVCAYAVTYLSVPTERKAILELTASNEYGMLWFNREQLTTGPVLLGYSPVRYGITLREGLNELLIKICERGGGWSFSARVCGPSGEDFNDLVVSTKMTAYHVPSAKVPTSPVEAGEVKRAVETRVVQPVETPTPVSPALIIGHGSGLVAQYFRGPEPSGEPVRVDVSGPPEFSYREDYEKPLPPPFSIRWSGNIEISEDGLYLFATESDDGSRLYIDGTLVVDNWGEHAKRYQRGTVELKKGKHEIRVEYFDAKWAASLRVLWTTPGESEKEIPETALSH